MTSALLIERNRETAKLTSAYLLEETEISNADVSIYVEEAGGSTRDVIITITRELLELLQKLLELLQKLLELLQELLELLQELLDAITI
ncbi:hypothetical protein F511_47202 [Dorcoceras hygrometricum]|uniref:Uncharacterized protein n=1 Tax=Dorcoceras hygrometricum TaxID=472368 RepID=A0A2Z6ZY86_9LAMI|nr:hypothetical protein F511_47202 [Dorcoceras hygrometricum]